MNLNESSLSRVYKHYQKHDTGTISAFRYARDCGNGKQYTVSENLQRSAVLKAKLLKLGYGVTKIKGTYIENYGKENAREVDEESYFVVDSKDGGKLRQDLIALGGEFDQDSITFSKADGEYYLISTNTCPSAYPGNGKVGKEEKLGKPNYGTKYFKDENDKTVEAEFFSKVKGRVFVFREADEKTVELGKLSFSEFISVSHLSKQTLHD